MLERIQSDFTPPKVAPIGVTNRADLAAVPAPQEAELRDRAVAPSSESHGASTDADASQPTIHVIGQIRNEGDKIQSTEKDKQDLDKIYAALFSGYEALTKGDDPEAAKAAVKTTDKAIADLGAVEAHVVGEQKKPDPGTPEAALAKADQANDANPVDRDKTVAKIEVALRKVSMLREKLTEKSESAHDRLMNINSSISGLNTARSQVDDSQFSLTSASSAVDVIMVNLRALVVAHGNVSPDIVRLVLN